MLGLVTTSAAYTLSVVQHSMITLIFTQTPFSSFVTVMLSLLCLFRWCFVGNLTVVSKKQGWMRSVPCQARQDLM